MTRLRIHFVCLAVLAIGCGDDDAGGLDAGRDSGGGVVDSGGGTDAGGGVDSGSADAGFDANGALNDAGPPVVITATIENVTATGGCMPIVPEDPIQVEFDVVTHNSGTVSTTAMLFPVTLTYMNAAGMMAMQQIEVDPNTVLIRPGDTRTHVVKTMALMDLPMDCAYCGGGTVTVSLSVVAGDDLYPATGPAGNVDCVF